MNTLETRVSETEHDIGRAMSQLKKTLEAYEAFMDEADWGKSFLQAGTIAKANTVPPESYRLLKEFEQKGYNYSEDE